MVAPFLRLWWLNVEPHFIAFLTGKIVRPRISQEIGRFGPRNVERNVDQSFGKTIIAFSINLYCPFSQQEQF